MTPPTHPVLAKAAELLVQHALPWIDHAVTASREPFTTPNMLRPNVDSKRYGWMHYGIFFPRLPAPHRYSHVMTLLGATGTTIFDNDHWVTTRARDTATLLTSTAANGAYCYQGYSMANDCQISADGAHIGFGRELQITGSYPDFDVRVNYADVQFQARIHCTDRVSWFVKNFAYEHLSLLATCEGQIRQGEQVTPIAKTLCTFEYARSITPQMLVEKPLPAAWKLPADFFTYQIINLDDDVQLLLTEVRAQGQTAFKGMHVRSLSGRQEVFVEDVRFEVSAHTTLTDPLGRSMRVPERLRWTVIENGRARLKINGHIASPWRFGHGRGYAACYDFDGEFEGQPVTGQGYIEYVDCS